MSGGSSCYTDGGLAHVYQAPLGVGRTYPEKTRSD